MHCFVVILINLICWQKKSPEAKNSSAEDDDDDDDEGNEDEKDYNIITGAIGDCASKSILKSDDCHEDVNSKHFGRLLTLFLFPTKCGKNVFKKII